MKEKKKNFLFLLVKPINKNILIYDTISKLKKIYKLIYVSCGLFLITKYFFSKKPIKLIEIAVVFVIFIIIIFITKKKKLLLLFNYFLV